MKIRSLMQSGAQWAAATGAAIFFGMSAPAIAEPEELIFNIFIPAQAGIVKDGLVPWAQAVEEASNGTLKLTIPTSSMAPTPALWDAVEEGLIDIALVVNAFRSNQVTLPTILNIPLVDGNAEQVSRALWETHYEHFEAADEFGELLPLAGFTVQGPQIMSVEKHVNTLEDLQGMKFRVEGAQIIELMSRLGATPVGADGLESFELLTGGIVDATITPFGSAMVQGQIGVTNEITLVPGGFSRSGFTIIINRERFEGLPEEAQAALLANSGAEVSAMLGAVVDDGEAVARAAFEADGAVITEASEDLVAAIREEGQFIVDEWLVLAEERGLNGQEVLDFYLSRVAAGH